MSEVEKMYRNARVYPRVYGDITKETFENKVFNMADMCNEAFTAEKQIQLENFLLEDSEDKTFMQFEMLKTIENKFLYVYRFSKNNSNLKRFDALGETRKESLARLINNLWQDLTEEERTQIKEILE